MPTKESLKRMIDDLSKDAEVKTLEFYADVPDPQNGFVITDKWFGRAIIIRTASVSEAAIADRLFRESVPQTWGRWSHTIPTIGLLDSDRTTERTNCPLGSTAPVQGKNMPEPTSITSKSLNDRATQLTELAVEIRNFSSPRVAQA